MAQTATPDAPPGPGTPLDPFTATTRDQAALTQRVRQFYSQFASLPAEERREHLRLRREAHARYAGGGLSALPAGFTALDASRPWIVFWVVHSLALLEAPLPAEVSAGDVAAFLGSCQHPDGGFGGGPQQLPHLAPTYAAVAALATLGRPALDVVDRAGVARFISRMAVPAARGGGFQVCDGGEVDARACYTAMAAAHMLRLDVAGFARQADMVDFLRRCQTYEGGLGGEPGNEAHGGYTYCGLAALMLAGSTHVLHLPRLLHWAVHCQGTMEGGFMGRTNKLVDGCYSFWQGALFPLLQRLSPQLLAQTGVPVQPAPAFAATSVASPSRADVGSNAVGVSRDGGPDAASQVISKASRSSISDGGGLGPESAQGSAVRRITVPPLPDVLACAPAAAARAQAATLKATADAAVQAALAAQLPADSAGGAADDSDAPGPATGWQRRGLASERVRQLADTAGAALEAASAAAAHADAMQASAAELLAEQRRAVLPRSPQTGDADTNAAGVPSASVATAEVASAAPNKGTGPSTDGHQPARNSDAPTPASSDSRHAPAPLVHRLPGEHPAPLYDAEALQLWLLQCCQTLKGGLRDKPGKPVDYYHTCYCLSGLSVSQHSSGVVLGPAENLLAPADLLCNVVDARLASAMEHYKDAEH